MVQVFEPFINLFFSYWFVPIVSSTTVYQQCPNRNLYCLAFKLYRGTVALEHVSLGQPLKRA